MTEHEMLGLILEASREKIGIKIETNDVDAFKQLFYRTQKKQGTNFKLLTSPTPNELWIVHADSKSNT